MADTRKLWEMFRQGVYDVCLSTVTLQEIDDCSEPISNNADGLKISICLYPSRFVIALMPRIVLTFTICLKFQDIIQSQLFTTAVPICWQSSKLFFEYNYEITKDMTDKERMDYYNNRGREVQRKLERMKAAG